MQNLSHFVSLCLTLHLYQARLDRLMDKTIPSPVPLVYWATIDIFKLKHITRHMDLCNITAVQYDVKKDGYCRITELTTTPDCDLSKLDEGTKYVYIRTAPGSDISVADFKHVDVPEADICKYEKAFELDTYVGIHHTWCILKEKRKALHVLLANAVLGPFYETKVSMAFLELLNSISYVERSNTSPF